MLYKEKITSWIKQHPKLFYSGLCLAILHFAYAVYIVLGIATASGMALAQWQMEWCKFGYIDFPISLIVGVLLKIPLDIHVDFLHILPDQMGSFTLFWLPAFFHIVIGTLYYFLFPALIYKLSKWLSHDNRNSIIHGMILCLPILCSLSEFSDFLRIFFPVKFAIERWWQSGCVGFWLFLLFCLLITQNHYRLRVLLHFLMFPFVSYFLMREIMFFVIENYDLYSLYDNNIISFLLCYP